MIARTEKFKKQAHKLVISKRDAEFHGLKHDDIVEIEVRKGVGKKSP